MHLRPLGHATGAYFTGERTDATKRPHVRRRTTERDPHVGGNPWWGRATPSPALGHRPTVSPMAGSHRSRRSRRIQRRRKKLWLALAGTAAAAGLVVAGSLAWLTVGVSLTKPDSDVEVTSQIRKHWEAGSPTYDKNFVGIIRIPRFGKNWEFSIARGTDLNVLAHGTGWYPEGARPGQVGNVVVSAHRVTHTAPFRDFPKLRRGDRVIIETRTRTYTYKLVDDGDATTVSNKTLWPLWPVPDPNAANAKPTDRTLTLITCAAMFHTDNRLVARAQQVSSAPKRA